MKHEDFCEFIFRLRDGSVSRAEMARKYPWHKNTIVGYEKDRLPDIDYLYAVSVETGYEFGELIRMRLQAGILELSPSDTALISFESPASSSFIFKEEKDTLLVEDDSMAPTILKGSHVSVDPTDIALVQGSVYALKINNSVVPRRVQYGLNDEIILLPENNKYNALNLSKNDVSKLQILGRVVRCINPV